jgi:hypothetical protein
MRSYTYSAAAFGLVIDVTHGNDRPTDSSYTFQSIVKVLSMAASQEMNYINKIELRKLLNTGTNVNVNIVRFEVFTAVTMKNGVFWYVMPRGSCKNQSFGET